MTQITYMRLLCALHSSEGNGGRGIKSSDWVQTQDLCSNAEFQAHEPILVTTLYPHYPYVPVHVHGWPHWCLYGRSQGIFVFAWNTMNWIRKQAKTPTHYRGLTKCRTARLVHLFSPPSIFISVTGRCLSPQKDSLLPWSWHGSLSVQLWSFGLIGQLKDAELRGVPFDATFLDDVLVHSASSKEHAQHLKEVFRWLWEAGHFKEESLNWACQGWCTWVICFHRKGPRSSENPFTWT